MGHGGIEAATKKWYDDADKEPITDTNFRIIVSRKLGALDMKYNIPDRVIRDIITFSKEYNIQKVVLFGSRAKGTHTNRSDVDLAVSGGDFDSFYWAVKENVHSLLTFDIIEWDADASEELKKEIEKDGVVIYEKA